MYKCIFCLISNDESNTTTACADTHLYECLNLNANTYNAVVIFHWGWLHIYV